MEMMAVAIRQGASIPRAMSVIGGVLVEREGDAVPAAIAGAAASADVASAGLGRQMLRVAAALNRGAEWDGAWAAPAPEGRHAAALQLMKSALEPSWRHGISPLLRIETTIEQIDLDERRSIEESAARLSVRILVPMGLCFLPAFILIGVIPSIAAFAGR
ncbi:hypothetical protein GFD17_09975 [Bifidobacterium sp. SMB2]|uniref:Type II secretion system protein GspF domain-containing protein n=1 Tax=Bifidobacterium saimiriisciurei TaxID=2661627 RepID=A0ABX0CC50_9BIFI|nr:hypothetical protein [Bifidobacterium sp. SMB2]NEH12150.1 hypothetical protein [Bifidobacterium saimiriisciurei]